jgi:hypothetical protein
LTGASYSIRTPASALVMRRVAQLNKSFISGRTVGETYIAKAKWRFMGSRWFHDFLLTKEQD